MRKPARAKTESTKPKILIRNDMSAEEIIFEVMKNLKRNFDLASSNTPIQCDDRMYEDLSPLQTKNVIDKLAEEYHAIKFVTPWKSALDSCPVMSFVDIFVCKVQKTENFDSVFAKFFDMQKRVPLAEVLKLTYNEKQQLILNDNILIAQLRYNSINDRIVKFLIEHPNKTFTRRDLEINKVLHPEKKEDKDLFVVLDDLNLPQDLKNLFFGIDLSSHSIHLRNPVYWADMDKEGIRYVDMRNSRREKKNGNPD